jgi:hypothetical protein
MQCQQGKMESIAAACATRFATEKIERLQKKPDAFMRSNFEWEQTEREASEVEA